MKANYPKKYAQPVYVKRTKENNKKATHIKAKQDIKKNQRRISRKGIQ